jgi:hypothetical protein
MSIYDDPPFLMNGSVDLQSLVEQMQDAAERAVEASTILQQAHFETVRELQDAAERAVEATTIARECWEGWHEADPAGAAAYAGAVGETHSWLGEALAPGPGGKGTQALRVLLLCGQCGRPVRPAPRGDWECPACEAEESAP